MITKIILKSFKPFLLASLLATYTLGAGLVQYIRSLRAWDEIIQGGFFLFLVVLSFELLQENQQLQDIKNWPKDASSNEVKRVRWVIALMIASFLTVAVTIFVDWMMNNILGPGIVFLVAGYLILCAIYFLSGSNKALRPFRILIEALLFVVLPPAMAFFIQSSEFHRFLTLVVVGLIPAFLAYRVLIQLKSFIDDRRYGKITFVTYIGWEKAMVVHNALILLTYLIFAFIAIIGFPWFLLWPVFLTLPIGLVEIWLLERVHHGSKPLWRIMQFASACVLFIPIYLLGFAFWIR